jgi:sulfatase maturation enzyme AslB (radical SAM superfamily)
MIKFPKIIQFETNILCNAACSFCPHSQLTRGPRNMDDDVWKKIVDESRDRGVIYRPFLINEPLTEKRLPEIIRYIKQDASATVELNSNAGLLTEPMQHLLLETGLDVLRFSVDGFSQDTYRKTGRGDNYDKVFRNINEFVELVDKSDSPMVVHVRMIDMDVNRHEQQPFLDYWVPKVDFAQIVPLYHWPWNGQERPLQKPCPKIREEMFFYSNGQATLCCWDNYERGVIGDIHDNTVEEIWIGETNQKYRQLLNKGRREEILLCSKCDAFKEYDFSQWPGY